VPMLLSTTARIGVTPVDDRYQKGPLPGVELCSPAHLRHRTAGIVVLPTNLSKWLFLSAIRSSRRSGASVQLQTACLHRDMRKRVNARISAMEHLERRAPVGAAFASDASENVERLRGKF